MTDFQRLMETPIRGQILVDREREKVSPRGEPHVSDVVKARRFAPLLGHVADGSIPLDSRTKDHVRAALDQEDRRLQGR